MIRIRRRKVEPLAVFGVPHAPAGEVLSSRDSLSGGRDNKRFGVHRRRGMRVRGREVVPFRVLGVAQRQVAVRAGLWLLRLTGGGSDAFRRDVWVRRGEVEAFPVFGVSGTLGVVTDGR